MSVEGTLLGEPLLEVADPGSHYLIVFVPALIAGEPACLEHDELRWADAGALAGLPLAPSDRRFVQQVLERSV